jgi:hypothetical protein
VEKLGESIGKSVAGQRTGKRQSIVQQVNTHNLSQVDAVIVIKAAYEKGLGLRIFTYNDVNGDVIVSSVMPGKGQPVVVISTNGLAYNAKADILLSGMKIVLTNIIIDP